MMMMMISCMYTVPITMVSDHTTNGLGWNPDYKEQLCRQYLIGAEEYSSYSISDVAEEYIL